MSTNHIENCYDLLGVKKDATTPEIKKAFTKMAVLCHPDKAPEGEEEVYEKKYQDILNAYRILTNDEARKQYDQAIDSTKGFIDLKAQERDINYHKATEYKTVDEKGHEKFDRHKFMKDFEKESDPKFAELKSKFERPEHTNRDVKTDYQKMLEQRDRDMEEIKPFKLDGLFDSGQFDNNRFQHYFDKVRNDNPTDLDEFNNVPSGLFATTGMDECDPNNYIGRVDFSGSMPSELFTGHNNPNKDFDFSGVDTSKQYNKEDKLNRKEAVRNIQKIIEDRENLLNLKPEEYQNEPTFIEQQYSELFAEAGQKLTIEQLEKGEN